MNKNDEINVEIIDIGVGGEGVGKVDGFPIFVKDAIVGDVIRAKVIKAKKTHMYGRLLEIITPSTFRIEAVCPIAKTCGGCQVQEMSYEAQLVFKQNKVVENLKRIAGIPAGRVDSMIEPIVGMDDPYHYRNKAQFPIRSDVNGEPVTGFYARRSHDIIPNTNCVLGVKVNEVILNMILGHMKQYGIKAYNEKTHEGFLRHVLLRYGFHTDEIMVCFVINSGSMKGFFELELLLEKLIKIPGMTSISYSANQNKTNVIMGENFEVIWGKSYITDTIGDIKFRISPLSFFQVNPKQTEKLYELALSYADLHGTEVVWDLYCGIGTISLYVAKYAKEVFGVEVIPQAIANAKSNSIINDINNVTFLLGKAEEVLPKYYEDFTTSQQEKPLRADVIFVDPPRKGCDEKLLNTIVKMEPSRLVYISCDTATFSRDVKILEELGYELQKVRPIDQFPMTVHCECVSLLTRGT